MMESGKMIKNTGKERFIQRKENWLLVGTG